MIINHMHVKMVFIIVLDLDFHLMQKFFQMNGLIFH